MPLEAYFGTQLSSQIYPNIGNNTKKQSNPHEISVEIERHFYEMSREELEDGDPIHPRVHAVVKVVSEQLAAGLS